MRLSVVEEITGRKFIFDTPTETSSGTISVHGNPIDGLPLVNPGPSLADDTFQNFPRYWLDEQDFKNWDPSLSNGGMFFYSYVACININRYGLILE